MKNNGKIKIFICMLAIVFAILITYRITNPAILIPDPEFDEYPVSSSKYLIKQRKIIDEIVNNFNDVKLINKYINNYSFLRASSEGNTIVVDYKDNEFEKKYIFVLDSNELSINSSIEDTSVLDKLFKIMVEANQRRLGNNNDFSDYFVRISNHSFSCKAFTISIKENNIVEYIIHVDKMILLIN